MTKKIRLCIGILLTYLTSNAQTVRINYPSLFVQDPDSSISLSSLEKQYIRLKDTTGLIHVYSEYLITGQSGEAAVTRSIFFFFGNKNIFERLSDRENYRLKLAIYAFYWGGESKVITSKLKEVTQIITHSKKQGWHDITLEAFHIKYYLMAGRNYLFKYPDEVKHFYEEYQKYLHDSTFLTMNLHLLMGRYATQQHDYATALTCFEKVYQISNSLHNDQFANVVVLFIAQIQRLTGNNNEALASSRTVIEKVKNNADYHSLDLTRWANEEMARVYEKKGYYKSANEHWSAYDFTIKKMAESEGNSPDGQPSFLEKLETELANQTKEQALQQALLDKSRKNNRQLMYLIVTMLIVVALASLFAALWVRSKRRQLKKENELNILIKQEEEREQISRELHDYVGNTLIAIKNALPATNTKIHSLLSEVYGVIRATSHALNSSAIADVGLTETSQDFIEIIDQNKRIKAKFYGEEIPIEAIKLQTTFRIIQELLGNALKHSQSDDIQLSLYFSPEKLLIHTEDTGVGFLPDKIKLGNGLLNINHRVKLLEGDIEIDSKPEKGTSIWVSIPIN